MLNADFAQKEKTSVFLWEPDTYCRFELPSVLNTSVT